MSVIGIRFTGSWYVIHDYIPHEHPRMLRRWLGNHDNRAVRTANTGRDTSATPASIRLCQPVEIKCYYYFSYSFYVDAEDNLLSYSDNFCCFYFATLDKGSVFVIFVMVLSDLPDDAGVHR